MTDPGPSAAPSPYMLRVPMRAAVLVITALILAGLIFLYIETYNMVPSILPGYPGDAFFPRMVLAFSIFWAVVILFRGLLLPQDAAAAGAEPEYLSFHWLEYVSVFVLVLLYSQLLEPVGFEITTIVLMMVLLVPRLRATMTLARALGQSLALSTVTMLLLYLGFGPFLKIALPLLFLPIYF